MAEPGSALERARALLDAEARERAAQGLPREGYLDLLGGALPSTGATQDLMLTSAVPRIYERWWRPALGRIVKGPRGPGMEEERLLACEILELSPGDGVLDVACGPGNFSRAFATAVGGSGLVVGVDASETMLARGAAELRAADPGNLLLVRGDATALPFVDRSFDAACCFAALHLFEDPLAALDEMRRVLTPGGRIALMTSARRGLGPAGAAAGALERLSGMRLFGREEIAAALEERGFALTEQRLCGMVQFVGGRLDS
ncbi:MAG: methyltransferase domain-containing protein [Solirubrobacterales bacterium]